MGKNKGLVIGVLILLMGGGLYLYTQSQPSQDTPNSATESVQPQRTTPERSPQAQEARHIDTFLEPKTPISATTKRHAITAMGSPKYAAGFKHFDYVNPQAPKGGPIKIGAIGVFDSLNPYSFQGVPASGLGVLGPNYIHDTLMHLSKDEPETLYGLIAESVEMPEDRSWMIFNLDKRATFSDGHPVTAEDVEFSVKTLQEHGRAFMQSYFKKVIRIEVLSKHRIKLYLKPKVDDQGVEYYERSLPLIIGRMVVFPKHHLEGKNWRKLKAEDILGSGPYRLKKVDMGRSITYERRKDYWAKDHPTQVGLNNFESVTYDYYRNNEVLFEAFKKGEFHVLLEANPKRWATNYDFPAVKDGRIQRIEYTHQRPVGFYGFVMNTRRPVFQDRKIREALILVFDFHYANKNFYYSALERSSSYFENTDLASQGLPSPDEVKLLEPHRDSLPEEVFTTAYTVPFFRNSSEKRPYLRRAKALLMEAGCTLENGKIIHPRTGKPFVFEIMVNEENQDKLALSLQRDLKALGIQMTIKQMDTAQYWRRTPTFNYDMMIFRWSGSLSPSGSTLQNRWGVKSYDREGSINFMGVKTPVVDALVEHVNKANSRESLRTAIKALDRVLLWGHYVIPLFHDNKNRVAVWDKFGHPPFDPLMGISLTTWWSKEAHP